jgi:hypothetical protein
MATKKKPEQYATAKYPRHAKKFETPEVKAI